MLSLILQNDALLTASRTTLPLTVSRLIVATLSE